MNKKETDISLIRKYLNGELDAKAMHLLEKRAQSDPFLMDALDGYGYSGKDQSKQLGEISNRLKQRVGRKGARIIPWKFIAAAASVMIVLTIGGLQLLNKRSVQKKMVAANVIKPVEKPEDANAIKPVEKSEDTVRQQTNFNKRNDIAALRAAPQLKRQAKFVAPVIRPDMQADDIRAGKSVVKDKNEDILASAAPQTAAKSKDNIIADKDTTPLNEVVVMGYATQKKKDVTGAVSSVTTKNIQDSSSKSLNKMLQGRVAGVTVTSDNDTPGADSKIFIRGAGAISNSARPLYVVDGVPVKGIANLNPKDIKSIDVLKDANATAIYGARASNGVVIVTTKKGGAANADSAAHPQTGWNSFNAYLKTKAISPDGKKGVVKLSFQVNPKGVISDIKVTKGLSAETDQKAIDLITNGPGWTGSKNGQPKKIKLRIKFSK